MKAVRGVEGGVAVVEIEEPPGAGELIELRSASICGSDFGYIQAGTRFILGHELAGVASDGSAVAVEAMYGCGNCPFCTEGRYNLCARQAEAALGLLTDGGMAEHFRAPTERLVPLPAGLKVADGSLVEPTALTLAP